MKYLSRPEELVLLAIWKMEDEAYGVNIRNFVRQLTGKYWSVGAIYVPLDRLENKGFLKSKLSHPTPERGGKSKRFYEITSEGLKELEEIRKIYLAAWDNMPDVLVKKA